MNIQEIIDQLQNERDRISNICLSCARSLVTTIGTLQGSTYHRGAGNKQTTSKRKPLSAAAKKRISAAMKARWAQRKKGK